MSPIPATGPFQPAQAGPAAESVDRIDSFLESPTTPGVVPTKYLTRVAVKADERIVLLSFRDVLWIQSHGNLLRLHLETGFYEHRMTIQSLYKRLDPEHFLRVHRNAIVNLDHVLEFELPRHGHALVHLRNGVALPVSKTGRVELRRVLLSHHYASSQARSSPAA